MRPPARHPSREELLAYAESLVDRGVPVSQRIAAHVNRCERCADEVRGFRGSLSFTASAQELEPSKDLSTQILLAAQQQKELQKRRWRLPASIRTLSVAASVLALAGFGILWFCVTLGIAEEGPTGAATRLDSATSQQSGQTLSPAELQRWTDEINTLAEAVKFTPGKPQNDRERFLRRLVAAATEDLAAARDARRRYPSLPSAKKLERDALNMQRHALRALFLYQDLPVREPAETQ